MKLKEFDKADDAARRKVTREFGFRQSSYINWRIESGYFFCLYHLTKEKAYLTVKPMYADDLWWDIFGIPENKQCPQSLRGTGVFSIEGQTISQYLLFTDDVTSYTDTGVMEEIWRDTFNKAVADIRNFIELHPEADSFMPSDNTSDPDRLLYLMALLHQGRTNEVLQFIHEALEKKHRCRLHSLKMDSYGHIMKWCEKLDT